MKKLLVPLLISILAIFVFTGCQGLVPGEGEGEGEVEEVTVEIDGAVEVGGKTYVSAGSHDITVTFSVPVSGSVFALITDCSGYYGSKGDVVLFPNEDKTVWTGSGSFVASGANDYDDCCASYVKVNAGECEADLCIEFPVIVDSEPPVAYLNVCSGECVCDGCELTFTTTSVSSLCAPDEMDCYDDCSGVAGWSIEIYDAPPYDECCEVPCEEPFYTCSGTDCPVECVTPCLEAFYTDELTEFYIIFSMWDKVGNRLQEGAMVTMSDACEIERIIPYTGAVEGEVCVDPLYLTNLCENDNGDEGDYTLAVNIVGNGIVTKNPALATYTSGTVVALDPEADTGWSFTGWSGDLTGSVDPENITMDGNKTVTATFEIDVDDGPESVNLGISGDGFVILSKSGITNTGSHLSDITGDIGSSPITAAAMDTVFCSEISGTIYGVNVAYTGSGITTCFQGDAAAKTLVDNAVLDMEAAYTDATGRTNPTATELYGGIIGGRTFTPGLYKWSTDVSIATDVTLSGGANDVWIFQIAGNLSIASGGSVPSGIKILLNGGAQASNIIWQVGGATGATLGTYSTFEGTILSAKQIIIETGAVLNGRAWAQTQVTLDQSMVTMP